MFRLVMQKSVMNEKAIRTNDTATFASLSMPIPPLMIFLVSRFAKVALQRLGGPIGSALIGERPGGIG